MRTARAFRSANTIRVTIPRNVRHALNLTAGDVLAFEHVDVGKIVLTNLSKPPKKTAGRPRKFNAEWNA